MIRVVVVALLVGCGGPDNSVRIEETDTVPTTTDTDDPPPQLSGGCAVQPENVLRYDCVFDLTGSADLEISLEGGDRSQIFHSEEILDRHEITLWRMRPETTYSWTAVADGGQLSGEFTTGPLPSAVDIEAVVTGTGTADSIVVPFQCGAPGHLISIDSTGQVEWYQNMTIGLGVGLQGVLITGFDATSDSLIALLGRIGIAEYDWTGELIGGALVGQEYAQPTHHAVFRKDELRFVLNVDVYAEPDGDYLMDGIYVFDSDWNVLGEWSLRDVLTPSGGGPGGGYWASEFPGAIDYSHANGIYVDDSGDWIVSMRGLDTVIKVRGDLAAPDFGWVIWSLTTSVFSPFSSDYLVTSTNGVTQQLDFSDQHHAHLEDDGGLWMFDNGRFGDDSRGIRMTLDDANAIADIDAVFQLPELCAVQSSVYRLPNGHALLTCATSQKIYEFDGVSPDPVWEAALGCPEAGGTPLMVRGQPVSF